MMDAAGRFLFFGDPPQRIPQQGHPPCWTCPKHLKETPPEQRHPFDEADDFGEWVGDLQDWFREGRAVGFDPDISPLLRQVAALFDTAERNHREWQHAELITLALKEKK